MGNRSSEVAERSVAVAVGKTQTCKVIRATRVISASEGNRRQEVDRVAGDVSD